MEQQFPTERAARTVQHLAGEIGLRIPGQPGFQRALDWLREQLESLEGWEVDVQYAASAREVRKSLNGTCHANLVARFRGAEPGAILVNSHLDSPPSSVGAADDGAAVAVMLEAARLISAGARPHRSLLFLFNGSEEYNLGGAISFMEQHPWAKDAVAFINLEAAGCDGPCTLVQASNRVPSLLKAYAGVPRPTGTVAGQDVFESRIFPNDTDYRIFAGNGLPGYDLILTGDGYAYHTWRDRPERVTPGALQEMGSTLMALLERLDREPDLTPRKEQADSVYFDLPGRLFVHYPKRLAPVLLGLGALAGAYAAWGLPWWTGLLRQLAALLAALLLPVGAAWVMGKLMRFDLWWYAHPAVTGAAWVSLALAAVAGVQALFPLPTPAAWSGGLCFWLLLGAAAIWRRLGSAYLPTAWLLSGTAGLLLWPWSPLAAVAVAVGGGAVVSASAVTTLLRFLLAHLGRNAFPSHIALAGLFGFVTMAAATFVPLPPAVMWAGVAALLCLAVAAVLPAVTERRSEQLTVIDLWRASGAHRLLFPLARQFSPGLRVHAAGKLEEPLWKQHLLAPKAAVALPLTDGAAASVAPPVLDVIDDQTADEQRRVTLRCTAHGFAVILSAAEKVLDLSIDAGAGRPVMRAD
ncbi:MAG TPA: M28 family peptidase, partial [Symbiobacteriaceae bacterium]|nr:M28 family peptidase [Symbiobacteriaceae bacterium]